MKKTFWAAAALCLLISLMWGLRPKAPLQRVQSPVKPPLTTLHATPAISDGTTIQTRDTGASNKTPGKKSGSPYDRRLAPAESGEHQRQASARGFPSSGKGESATPKDMGPLVTKLPPGLKLKDIPDGYADNLEQFLRMLEETREQNELEEEDLPADPLYFTSLLPDQTAGPLSVEDRFAPGSGRIYAVFRSDTRQMSGRDSVLVRWFDPDGRTPWYEYVHILPDMPFNFVWYESPHWDPGIYHVRLYGLDNDVGLLAAGSYTVEEDLDHIGNLIVIADPSETITQTDFGVDEPVYVRFNYEISAGLELTLLVYKIETGETFISDIISLPRGSGEFLSQIKEAEPVFPPGSYDVELWEEDQLIRGRVRFFLH